MNDAIKLLQWLAFSFRPISLEEAVEVLATDPNADDGPLFDPRQRLRDPQDVLTICPSLVVIGGSDAILDEWHLYPDWMRSSPRRSS